MKAIIFGINGQDGHYLKLILAANNIDVVGVSRSKGDWLQGNVADFVFVETFIKQQQPDFIFHLAANSSTSHSLVFENHETISTGALNILESAYRYSKHSKIFLSGSAVQFENKGLPIDEETPFAAISPYAVSRIQSVYAGRYYRALGINVYTGYFFHHDSPLRPEKHINQKIIRAVQRIAKGSNEKIEIGNLNIRKEFNYAGDLMKAVWVFINQNIFFEMVIGCGKAYTLQQWVESCFTIIGKDWKKYIVCPDNFKPDFDILVSRPEKLLSTGWRPEVDFQKLTQMMISYE